MSRLDEAALQEAETAYLSGRSLKAIAKEVGIGHERLSRSSASAESSYETSPLLGKRLLR